MTCCSSCLENAISQKTPCPHCPKNEMSVSATKFEYRDEEINALYVYCSNKESGCGWQGRVDNIDDHLHNVDGCQFHEVPCPYNCGKMLQRQLVAVHVRNECLNYEIDCQYCHINEKRYLISGEHKDVCPKFPLACPNKCGIGRVLRVDMEDHRAKCPFELVQCVYHNVGCTATILCKDIEQHHSDNLMQHLKLELAAAKIDLNEAVDKITELETIIHRTNTALHVAIISSVLAWCLPWEQYVSPVPLCVQ